jgi:hypothetical protein
MEEQEPGFIPYQNASLSIEERVERTAAYLAALQKRRSVCEFSATVNQRKHH